MYTSSHNTAHVIQAQYFPVDFRFPDEPYTTPDRAAELVVARNVSYRASANYVDKYTRARTQTPSLMALRKAVANTDRAVTVMSGIGYMNFRHMISAGFMLTEIAEDCEINVLDLMAFMSSHKDAEKHAEIDTELCADARFSALIKEIQNSQMHSKYEGDKLKQLVYATELLVKRLSHKWVGRYKAAFGEDGAIGMGMGGMTVNMNIGQLASSITNNTQQNYSPAQQEAAAELEAYEASLRESSQRAISLDTALQDLSSTQDIKDVTPQQPQDT